MDRFAECCGKVLGYSDAPRSRNTSEVGTTSVGASGTCKEVTGLSVTGKESSASSSTSGISVANSTGEKVKSVMTVLPTATVM